MKQDLGKTDKMSLIWKGLVVVAGCIGLISNAWNMEQPIVMLYFYTILSNLLCVGTFLYLMFKGNRSYPVLKGGLATAVLIVMLIFNFILRPTSEFYKNQIGLADAMLHYVMPCMVILDFILFDQHNQIKWYHPIEWLSVPIIYVIFVFIRAQIGQPFNTGYGLSLYPYLFLDVDVLGIVSVCKWIMGILVFYLLIGYLIMGLDKGLYKLQEKNKVKIVD